MGSFTLVQMCIRKVALNMDVLERQTGDLPASLLQDLMPHLNIYYLDRIEKAAQLKGVSCSSAWAAKWRDLNRTWRWKLKFLQPEKEDWKQMCLESYFHKVLLRKSQAHSSALDMTDLSVAAKYVQVLSLYTLHDVQKLASEELRLILATLETVVRTLRLIDAKVLLRHRKSEVLFVLHRLLDHGSVKKLVLKRTPDSHVFRWIMSRCKGSSRIDDGPAASKCPRLHPLMEEIEYSKFCPSCNTNVTCPEGQIHSVDLEVCLTAASRLLPSWIGLRSLHLSPTQFVCRKEVVDLVESLRKLFLNPHCALKDLSFGNMYIQQYIASLLISCPTLHTLSLEIGPRWDYSTTSSVHFTSNIQLSLEKLTLKAGEIQTTLECLPTVLQHAPNLRTLHITGIRQAHSFLHTLPESNPSLKVLLLEDVNLAECHSEIIYLLENSMLEELSLKDCRLLEKCTEKKDFLVPFVAAAKNLCSLRSLSLSQNRLASSVIQVADLFLEHPGNIVKLDLSSNFILPADLLEFSQRIEAHHPLCRFTLDLRFNPLNRDPLAKGQALRILRPFCEVLTDEWDFKLAMISS
ncbi:leucine-rich repeat-containing protein 41 isoform X2 [Tachysurus fulvidraco]|uniref:leucine-rich repeat-containing protein 41 isoform X2 n=1 Tax=Tachysurus fulvidraco TaxID=1234273 RepID=UPI000F5175D3|nr:leucine-rich repeat-containing protein 41 isoform X2 [Tachysurus fulvidraco]